MDAVLVEPKLDILEIGAGAAGALHAFLRKHPEAKGIAMELSPASLESAAGIRMPALRAIAGNALQLPFRDRSLDAVVAFEVIEHLPDVAQAFGEMLRVLRRPGHLIIGLPNHASLWTPVEDWLRRRDRRAFGVEVGRGAWRWWARNAALAPRKRLSRARAISVSPTDPGGRPRRRCGCGVLRGACRPAALLQGAGAPSW